MKTINQFRVERQVGRPVQHILRRNLLAAVSVLLLAGPIVHSARGQVPLPRPEHPQGGESRQSAPVDAADADRMLRELGLTREEVRRRAEALGISPEQYVQSLARSVAQTPGSVPDTIQYRRAGKDAGEWSAGAPPESLQPSPPMRPEGPSEPDLPRAILGPNGLPYFGYDVFGTVPSAFEPTAAGPVDPDYVIAPDDVLKLSVWGQVELQQELTVDREGRLFIPTVGQVLVTGLTLREATAKLTHQMSRSYSGLVSRPPRAWLDLTVARLRPKRVFLMGEVRQPGGYTMSSHATVFSALYSVGGPTVNGSLRDIRVIRAGKILAHVDLYAYLTGAEETNDLRIQSNDIVFVPVRGMTVSIRGEVRRPAIYELKKGEGCAALLRLCGGVLPTAYDVQAQIDRIQPLGRRSGGVDDRVVVDVPLRAILEKAEADAALADGDEVRIFAVLDEQRNYVSIEGSVWRPGRYELREIRTVRDLIRSAAGVQPRTYLAFAHLTRLNNDFVTRRILSFNLGRLLEDSASDIVLEPRDRVYIYTTEITEVTQQHVTIRGSIRNPGRYALNAGMTLKDLVALAGGYAEDAERLEAEVSRVRPSDLRGDTLAVILRPALPQVFAVSADRPVGGGPGDDSASADFALIHRDEILIRPNPAYVIQQYVRISGDIKYPGTYTIRRRGERVSELLERAGGPTRTSHVGGARFFRRGERLLLELEQALVDRNGIHDVVMLGGDSVYIPSKPHTVLVSGEVNNPGFLSFIEGEDVSDYIDRAGGLTDSSNYAVLIKPTGESRRVNFGWFRSDPEVPEGSMIEVLRIPPPPPETREVDVSGTVKDVFAILTSAATLAFIVWEVSK